MEQTGGDASKQLIEIYWRPLAIVRKEKRESLKQGQNELLQCRDFVNTFFSKR
jgi:hypothetical protein